MLSIGTVSAGNQAQREYHERQLAESRDDYYRESEGPAGTWIGSQAAALGLEGEVTVEQFGRLLDGQDPTTGEDLGGRLDRRKTVAFDLAFSAPKSVSLLRMAADEPTSKAVDRAHDRAVRSALAYIEQEGWKGRQRVTNEDGTRERVTVDGTGVVGVLYRHETTRNADPQLHSHAVVANIVQPQGEGEAQAINSQVLYWQAKTAGTVYQAVLRGELGVELGLEFDTPVNGLADIKGFDRELIDTYSTRRAEILQGLAAKGFAPGGAAAERVALESRRAKDMGLDHGLWRAEVREALERDGFGVEQTRALVRSPEERELVAAGVGHEEGARPRTVGERIDAAPLNALTQQRATEDARPIRQAAMSVPEGYTAEEVGQALEDVFADRRLVQVQGGERPRWTTERHLQLEERVQAATLARMSETTAPRIAAAGYAVPTMTPDGHPLSGDQQLALGQILTSGRGVEVIRARAGAGKTTIAGLAKTEFEAHGLKVVGVAPTLQALAELDDVGLETRDSLARTAFSDGEFSKVMRTMDHQTVVLVDEAAMSQTKEIAPLLQRAQETGAKVVAVGDDVQLAAVGAGGWFRYLAEHEKAPVLELTEVHRQRDPVERDRLNQLHRGDVTGWTRWADQHDRIHIDPTVEDAYATAVGRYARALDDVDGEVDRLVVMAPENAHRRALNEQLRRVVVDAGLLDRTREQNYGGILVAPGERLVATETVTVKGTSKRLVENGERFEVLAAGRDGVQALAVAGKRRGETVRLPAEILQPGPDGRRVVDHAYARTVHKAQGMTVDRSILFAPDPARLGRNLAYVGLTRTRDRADLVTVAPDRAAGLERLVRGMAERHDHQAALAIADPDQLDPGRVGRMSDPEIDEHRHALLTEAREAMTQLERLDREARGAWAGSRDARTDAQLLAERDQLAAAIDDRAQLLADQDPDGGRQRRGLMEQTIRQALDRDRAALERIDARLQGRDVVDVDQADDMQARIRAARAPVQRYVEGLLNELHQVHGQQIDRTPGRVEISDLPEHERPTAALAVERGRRARIAALDLTAAQQLGTGHPLVADWLTRNAPQPQRRADGRRPDVPVRLTPAQRELVDAIQRWRTATASYGEAGGPVELERLTAALGRYDRATADRDAAAARLAGHQEGEPSTLRRKAHDRWDQDRATLARDLEHTTDVLRRTTEDLAPDGGPQGARERVDALQEREAGVHAARRRAVAAERTLSRSGVAGAGEQRARRLLGHRDDLDGRDQGRYDTLAGRIAVADVLAGQPGAPTWSSLTTGGLERDVATWRRSRDLPLTDRQQQLVDRDHDRPPARER